MNRVELHGAFFWTCEECGRDHFLRSVLLSPEQVAELVEHEPTAELHVDHDGEDVVRVPAVVQCPDCDLCFSVFRYDEDEDEDENEDQP